MTYDLPGAAPRSKSDIRVGTAFATFVAWAFGDSGSVRVVVPAGYEAEATGSTATRSTSDGATVFAASGITDIGGWYLVVTADRKSALTSERIDLAGGEHVVVRAWPEDTTWQRQVRQLLTDGLPHLVELTGLDWPVAADLTVFEVHTPLLEGYAGVFFQDEDRIEISEDLDDLTTLHEASHAWFNGALFDGRWINEGFADTYAAKALDAMGSGGWAPNPVSPTDAAAVRLAAWVHPGRITDDATDAREQYGYEASWTVIRSLVADIGDDGMREVLRAAADRRSAYAGSGAAEPLAGPTDWRRLLDLLDEVGGATTADDLFRRWVVTDAQAADLDARAAARSAYAALVSAGAGWQPPAYVRDPLTTWSFPTATSRIAEASAVLARRDALAAEATRLGVGLPADLQTAYQAARDSLADADRVATTETAAIQALATAIDAVAAPRAPLVVLGLLGTTPEVDLAGARAAFSAGAADAAARAAAVTALIDGAVAIGRRRLLAVVAGLGVAVVLLVVAIVIVRRRRRRAARPGAAGGPPYATLADQPDPVEPDPVEPANRIEPTGQPPSARGDDT